MRRLLFLVGTIVLVDMMFYAAITPLLPVYAERFSLSKTGAGVLAGAYAAGVLLGSLPSGWLAMRFGARRIVLLGLGMMSAASVGFAFGDGVVLLDSMRFLQGLGGACTWAGGMGWLLSQTPADQRGATIGAALSTAVGGLLLGPVLGTLARAIGPEVPFGAVAVLGVALAVAALRIEAPPAGAGVGGRALLDAIVSRGVGAGMAFVTISALVFGAVEVLVPLRLDALGAGGALIGATFLAASGFEVVAQLLTGRATDRVGRGRPLRVGLAATVAFLVLLPLPQSAWPLAAIVAIGCAVCGAINTPAMALISDGVDRAGIDQSLGFGLVNLTWAGGQVVGAIAGGAVASATSDTVPYLALAALCAAALVAAVREGRRAVVASRAA
jgi:MFS family permease